MERCTVCGRSAEGDEKFTHLTLYVNGSEGTNACEDCRMDITNFVRNLSSSMNRAAKAVRKAAREASKGIGFGELMKIGPSEGMRPGPIQMTMSGRCTPGPDGVVTNLNMDSFAPSALADQIKLMGRVETLAGEVFNWNAESELWVEERSGVPRELRSFPAAVSGFPDAPLPWRFRFPQVGAALMEYRPDGAIHATIPINASTSFSEQSP